MMQFENPIGAPPNMQQTTVNPDNQGAFNQFQHQPTPFYIDNILGPSPPTNGTSSGTSLMGRSADEDTNNGVHNSGLDPTTNANPMAPVASSISPSMGLSATAVPVSYQGDDGSCHQAMINNNNSRPASSTSTYSATPGRPVNHQNSPGLVVPTPIQAIPGHPPHVLGYPPTNSNYPRPMYDPQRIPNEFSPPHIPYHHAGSYGPGPGLYPYPHPDYAAQAWLFERHAYTKLGRPMIWGPFMHRNMHKRKGGQVRFSNEQTSELEKKFEDQKYLSPPERKKLAKSLQLSERQDWQRGNKSTSEAKHCETRSLLFPELACLPCRRSRSVNQPDLRERCDKISDRDRFQNSKLTVELELVRQVKTWFQNRRAKWRRLKQDGSSGSSNDKQTGDENAANHVSEEDSGDDLSPGEQNQQQTTEIKTENQSSETKMDDKSKNASVTSITNVTSRGNEGPKLTQTPNQYPVPYDQTCVLSRNPNGNQQHQPQVGSHPIVARQQNTYLPDFTQSSNTYQQNSLVTPQFHHMQNAHSSYYPSSMALPDFQSGHHDYANPSHSINSNQVGHYPQQAPSNSSTLLSLQSPFDQSCSLPQ